MHRRHVETVVLLSHKKPDGHINVKVEFGEGEGKVPLDNIAKRAEAYKPKERVTYKMTNHTLFLFLVGVALLSEAHQTITVFLNQLQYERCGLNNSVIGLVYIVATLLGVLGVYSSAFTKRVGIRRSLILFCALETLSCLVLGSMPFALPSVISVLLLRLSNTLFQPLLADLQNRQITSRNRATALSVCGMLVDGIAIGTNLIFGALSDWNLSAAFYFGSAICTVGLLLFLLWLKKGSGALSHDVMEF